MEMDDNMEGGPRLSLTDKTRLGEGEERSWGPDDGCVSDKW